MFRNLFVVMCVVIFGACASEVSTPDSVTYDMCMDWCQEAESMDCRIGAPGYHFHGSWSEATPPPACDVWCVQKETEVAEMGCETEHLAFRECIAPYSACDFTMRGCLPSYRALVECLGLAPPPIPVSSIFGTYFGHAVTSTDFGSSSVESFVVLTNTVGMADGDLLVNNGDHCTYQADFDTTETCAHSVCFESIVDSSGNPTISCPGLRDYQSFGTIDVVANHLFLSVHSTFTQDVYGATTTVVTMWKPL